MCDPITAAIGGVVAGNLLGGKKKSSAPAASTTAKTTEVKTAAKTAAEAPAPTPAAPSASALPNPSSFANGQYDRARNMVGRDDLIVSLLNGAAGSEQVQATGPGRYSDGLRDANFRRKLRNRGGLSLSSGPLGSGDKSQSGTGVNFNA
jgi:hypothetical protein